MIRRLAARAASSRKRVLASAATVAAAAALALVPGASPAAPSAESTVLESTLPNGLRVVVVRNTLAPVVATDMTYLVGTRDDPANVPGMAHAQEHMMFRGTPDLSTSELGTVATALGGDFNASTSDTLTQFDFTVPAANLDAILRIESDRMTHLLDAQGEWTNERGAIEQEVLHDASSPGGDFFSDARAIAFARSPYAHEGVGTVAAFDRLTGPALHRFYDRWYAPNNAVFVIAGDVDPQKTVDAVRAAFAGVRRRAVPAQPAVALAPVKRTVIRRSTTLVYPLAAVGFRMPGVESPDFLPSFVLQEVLGSERGPFRALVDEGAALDGSWTSLPYVPVGQLAFATAALPPGADPSAMARRLESIVAGIARRGVDRDLFESTKRQAIEGQELSRNSIAALASDWATTIALDHEPSIAVERKLIGAVTLADVNRVAKRYLDPSHAIVGALTPSAGAMQSAPATPPQAGPENPIAAQPAAESLPPWARSLIDHVGLAPSNLAPVRSTLPNGITLIVQPESISDTVELFGNVKTVPSLQEPAGKEGVASVLEAAFDFGTQAQDRAAFRRSADAIDASLVAGTGFGLQTPSRSFGAAIRLLAENELRPRLDAATVDQARRRAGEELATSLNSTGSQIAREQQRRLLPDGDPTLRRATLATLESVGPDDVKAYDAAVLRPDLTTIVVVGDITPDAARTAVEAAFGDWHAEGPKPNLTLPPVAANSAGEYKLSLPSIRQDDVSLSQIVPLVRSSPQYAHLLLGDAILGGGAVTPEQSRLFRDIRQQAGLVYSIDSSLSTQDARSQFAIDFACLPSNTDRILGLVDGEVTRLQTQPVGDFELSLMKASVVRRTIIGDASVGSIGGSLLSDAASGLPLDQDRIDAGNILATDAAGVEQAFATYVRPKDFVKVVVGP